MERAAEKLVADKVEGRYDEKKMACMYVCACVYVRVRVCMCACACGFVCLGQSLNVNMHCLCARPCPFDWALFMNVFRYIEPVKPWSIATRRYMEQVNAMMSLFL